MMSLVNDTDCPSDAISEVKALAWIHLSGDGGLWELLEWTNRNRETNSNV